MFEVLTAHGTDAARWLGFFDRLPRELRDVHYTPAYARVQERLGHKALCAVYTAPDDMFVMQPFLLRKVPGGTYHDMTSLYGYGGPLSNIVGWSAGALMEWMEKDFSAWREANGVIAEFCVLHPLAEKPQGRLLTHIAQPVKVKDVVLINCDQTAEAITKDMRTDRRQNLGHAAGMMRIEKCNPWDFYKLYKQTMDRKGAALRWRMPQAYFADHQLELVPDHAAMIAVSNGIMQSASIILLGGRTSYYHFTGNADDIKRGANEYLIQWAAQLAGAAGSQWLHLGGGVTSDPADKLFAFKASLSPHRATVSTYRRVFNQDVYDRLSREAGVPEDEPFFPAYRAKEAA
jgi:hypothetical protein